MSTIEDARRTMREFLDDMAAIKPFIDPTRDDAEILGAAVAAARAKAVAAAKEYTKAVEAAKAGVIQVVNLRLTIA